MRNYHKTWKLIFSILLAFTVEMIILSVRSPTFANPSWWDTNWANRCPITVSGYHPENYQIMVKIPSDIPESDYPSIRFLENEDSGLLPYWIERDEGSYLPVAWVRRLENSDNTIWMYYRNSSASSAENGEDTFLFFDDFGGNQLDSSKWGKSGTGVDVYEYVLRLEDYNNWDAYVEHGPSQNIQYLSDRRVIEFRIKPASAWGGGMLLCGPGMSCKEASIRSIYGCVRFYFVDEWSGCQPIDKWYIIRADMYGTSKDKLRGKFYWGMEDKNYRTLKWTSDEKNQDWTPGSPNVDKYKLMVWDSGGTSSYYYDWFFVRKWTETEPSVTVVTYTPLLKSPADGAFIYDNTPTLTWEASSDNEPGLDHYEVWIDDNNVESVPADTTSYMTSELQLGLHRWKIVAIDVAEGRYESESEFIFTITTENYMKSVEIVSHDENSFRIRTGGYLLDYNSGTDFIEIYRWDLGRDNGLLSLKVGGGDPNLGVLKAENIDNILVIENENVNAKILGGLDWADFEISILLPSSAPGLINYSLKIDVTENTGTESFFAGNYPELSYRGAEENSVDPNLIDYLDGTPNSWSGGLRDEYCRDLNQFIFFGDPTVLKSTLFYYTDFTSLDRFFEDSDAVMTHVTGYTTHVDDVVKQPPGIFRTPKQLPISFGFDLPGADSSLENGSTLAVSNSLIYLAPVAPEINDPVAYSKRFIVSLASIYPLIEKPNTEYVNWPDIVEKAVNDLNSPEITEPLHNYALNSFKKYAEVFNSENALIFVENAENMIAADYDPDYTNNNGSQGTFGGGGVVEPVHYLFPYCQWGAYAEEFNSENVKNMFVDTEDAIMDLGQGLNYIFTFKVDVDASAPIEDGTYQYEGVGQYIYLMLYYHKFTGDNKYIDEAVKAADALLHRGFEYSYEFFATPFAPVALLRLYELTGEERYLEGSYIPLAIILRDSWLFNPDYGHTNWPAYPSNRFENRTMFLLNSARPNLSYANGWEEQALIEYLYLYLKEGYAILMPEAVQLTSELLRYKGTSLKDSLAPLHSNKSIIFEGKPREWDLDLNENWYIPLEPFGHSRDDNKLGHISQPPYCAGMLPEIALLQFHPLWEKTFLYVDPPIKIENKGDSFIFEVLAINGSYRAGLGGENASGLIVEPLGEAGVVDLEYDPNSGLFQFEVSAGEKYAIKENILPGKPIPFTPADGTCSSDNTPTFEWTVGDNADNHRLLVDNDSNFSSPEENVLLGASENSYTPTTQLSPDNYSWKVVAINTYGETKSSVWTFVVSGPTQENFYTYLENGWNLVGFIIENTPTNIFTGLSYYTDYYLYYYTPPAGPYGLQGPDQALEDNLGYWVWINRDNTIMTSGTPPDNREIHLVAGWNLVSFPVVNENTTPNNIFPGLSYYTDYYLYWYLAPGGPYQLQGPDEVLKDNLGYWAWINRDNMVTVP